VNASVPRLSASWCLAALALSGCGVVLGPQPSEPSNLVSPFSTTSSASPTSSPTPTRETSPRLPEAHRLRGTTVSVMGAPAALLVADGSIWAMSHRDTTLYRIEPRTRRVLAAIDTGVLGCGDLAAVSGAVYVTGCGTAPYLVRVDTDTNSVTATTSYAVGHGGVAQGVLWAPLESASLGLVPIDSVTLDHGRGIPLPENAMIAGVVHAGAFLWAGDENNRVVYQIDPVRRKVLAAIPLPSEIRRGYLIKHDGAPWVVDHEAEGALVRIDPEAGTAHLLETKLRLPSAYWGIAASSASRPGQLWARSGDNQVWLVDTRKDRVARIIEITPGGNGGDVQEHKGVLWVSAFGDDVIHRIPLPPG